MTLPTARWPARSTVRSAYRLAARPGGPIRVGRVLTMSSGGVYSTGLTVSKLEMAAREYKGTGQYARAKRAQVTLMRCGPKDTVTSESTSTPTFFKVMDPLMRTAAQGADTLAWFASDDSALESNGLFWLDRRTRPTHKLWTSKRSDTAEHGYRLWTWVGETAGHLPT